MWLLELLSSILDFGWFPSTYRGCFCFFILLIVLLGILAILSDRIDPVLGWAGIVVAVLLGVLSLFILPKGPE